MTEPKPRLGLWPFGLDLRVALALAALLVGPVRLLRRIFVRRRISGEARRIVFVSRLPRAREAKLAGALRDRGWRVTLIHEAPPNFDAAGLFAETRRVGSPFRAWMSLAFDPASLVHVFSQACDPFAYLIVRHAPMPAVFDPTDIVEAHDRVRGDELRCALYRWTRICVASAAGICARDLQLLHARRSLGYPRPRRVVFFPEYCWGAEATPRNVPSDGTIRFVVAGNVGLDPRTEADWSYVKVALRLNSRNCELHLYRHWDRRPGPDGADPYAAYTDLARSGVAMRVHPCVEARALPAALARYDAGIVVHEHFLRGEPSTHFNDAVFGWLGAARCFDYADAAVPFVANREFRFVRFLFARWGFFIEALPHLESVDASARAAVGDPKLRQLRARGRQAMSVGANIDRLERFYGRIAVAGCTQR